MREAQNLPVSLNLREITNHGDSTRGWVTAIYEHIPGGQGKTELLGYTFTQDAVETLVPAGMSDAEPGIFVPTSGRIFPTSSGQIAASSLHGGHND